MTLCGYPADRLGMCVIWVRFSPAGFSGQSENHTHSADRFTDRLGKGDVSVAVGYGFGANLGRNRSGQRFNR